MKDSRGEVIYVGKASSLCKRVKSYFRSGTNLKNLILSSRITDVEVIPVSSEAESLLLENKFIKEYQPKYNIDLKDGKSYPLIKITKEKFPSIRVVREERSDKVLYFGPFTDAGLLRKIVKFLREYYPVRNCSKKLDNPSGRVCTQYYIGKCSGPCEGKISQKEYGKIVEGVISFFEGKHRQFEKKLRKWLEEAISRWDFEEAQRIKERLFLLGKMEDKFSVRDEKELVSYGKENVLTKLGEMLNLKKIPNLIEGYDISNLGGTLATGSKVSFKGGFPFKDGYRRFQIKSVNGIDDYQMLREVIIRRFNSEKKRKEIPDLILIDGGKGQLNAVLEVIKKLNLDIPVISLAKQKEEIYISDRKNPISLPDDSPVLHLLQRLRNEAHRFAVGYHRILRRKKATFSFLDEISGIGKIRKQKIVSHFESIKSLASSGSEEFSEIGISEKLAIKIIKKSKDIRMNIK